MPYTVLMAHKFSFLMYWRMPYDRDSKVSRLLFFLMDFLKCNSLNISVKKIKKQWAVLNIALWVM